MLKTFRFHESMKLSIRPKITRRTKVLINDSLAVSIWGLENNHVDVDTIWNQLKDTLAVKGK